MEAPVTPELRTEFLAAMRKLAATITLVTTGENGSRHGMAATAVSSLSADPPALLVCVNRTTSVHGPVSRVRRFCVNLLEDRDADLFQQFIARTGASRFDVGNWTIGPFGLPCLGNAVAAICCTVEQQIDYGTHSIFIGRVEHVSVRATAQPLLYESGIVGKFTPSVSQVLRLGHLRYPVTDMDRAIAFYRDVLGLRLKFRDGSAWAEFDAGGSTLALEGPASPGSRPAGGITASLKVNRNLHDFVEDLRRAGAAVTDVQTGKHERTAVVTDPDGNPTTMYVSAAD